MMQTFAHNLLQIIPLSETNERGFFVILNAENYK